MQREKGANSNCWSLQSLKQEERRKGDLGLEAGVPKACSKVQKQGCQGLLPGGGVGRGNGKWSDLVCRTRCLEDGVGVGRCLQSPIKKFRMSQQTTEGLSEKEHHEWVSFRKVSLAAEGRTHWGRTGFFKPEEKDFGPPGGCCVWRMLCGPSSKVHFRPRDLEPLGTTHVGVWMLQVNQAKGRQTTLHPAQTAKPTSLPSPCLTCSPYAVFPPCSVDETVFSRELSH